ncbi:MAG: DUF2231 domain-containing protein [Chitinophagales bacterium]
MYSKAKIAGHPIHPMLVAYPIAFYTATFVCFIVYGANDDPFWFRVAYTANIAGVVMAALAALPGFIDWATGIPNGTKAKKTGLIHMGFNVFSLAVFAINAFIQQGKWNDQQPDSSAAVWLTGLGMLCTIAAGFYGWTLVQKHHVGVDDAAQ